MYVPGMTREWVLAPFLGKGCQHPSSDMARLRRGRDQPRLAPEGGSGVTFRSLAARRLLRRACTQPVLHRSTLGAGSDIRSSGTRCVPSMTSGSLLGETGLT